MWYHNFLYGPPCPRAHFCFVHGGGRGSREISQETLNFLSPTFSPEINMNVYLYCQLGLI